MKSNMLKKAIAAVSVMSLVAVSGMSALAAGSPIASSSDGTLKVESATAVDEDGNAVDVTLGTATDTPDLTAEEVKEVTGADLDATKVVVVDINAACSEENPVTVTVGVDGVKAGDKVQIWHYNGTSWEYLGTATAEKDNEVTWTFTDLSPVAFYVTKGGTVNSPATTTPVVTKTTTKTSPKTGE